MSKNHVQNIIIHTNDDTDFQALTDKINEFHAELIEHRLNQSNLTTEQKIDVINQIIENLKSYNDNGIISQ